MTLVVPDEVTVDLASMTLEQLGERARDGHAAVEAHLGAALARAIATGEVLWEVKKRLGPREWTPWVTSNLEAFGFGMGPICQYMRIAHWKEELPPDPDLTITDAYSSLKGLPRVPNDRDDYTAFVREEARALRSQGKTYREICEAVGHGYGVVYQWCNPKYMDHVRRRTTEGKRRRAAERKALAEKEAREELARLAKEKGGDLGRLHDLFRKRVMPMIDGAVNEGLSIEARALAVRLEDEINKALRA